VQKSVERFSESHTVQLQENAGFCNVEAWKLVQVFQNNSHIFWGNVLWNMGIYMQSSSMNPCIC